LRSRGARRIATG
jgi:hypothetical protein